jgi:predicted nucleic acid-binding protein
MRRYLVDTTPLAALLNNRPPALTTLRPLLTARELGTSILAYGEVVESLKGHPDFPRRHASLRALLRVVTPYLPSYPIMERYADIRRQLRPPYGPGLIGDIDTIIAATALIADLELITTDGDFLRVPGLRVLLLDRTTFQPLPR